MKKYILHIIFGILPIFSFAQLQIGTEATLTVLKDAQLYVPENIENNGIISNQGVLYATGNIVNNGQYNNIGELHLIGDTQTVDMQKDTVQKLIVSSPNLGPKNIVSDITVEEYISLQSGIVIPINGSMILLLENANTSDGSDISYVQGCMYAKGTGNKYFPIGIAETFMPVELHNIKGTDPVIAMCPREFTNGESPTAGKGAKDILNSRYWEQVINNGELENAQISLPILPVDANYYVADSVVVVMSNNYLGPYRSSGPNDEIVSRIPDLYTSSIDTANKSFYTLGIFNEVNFNLLYIPNALSQYSPNEEEKRIKIYGSVFADNDFSFVVTNQWGSVVFETNSVNEMVESGWDGTNKKTGRRESIGQYFYYLNGKTKAGEDYNDAGSIWIID